MEEDSFAENFTAAMDCRGVYLGQALAKKLECSGQKKLLDIGGGSGIYACSIVAQHPHLNAAVYEKAPVDKIAATLIQKRGFAEKVSTIQGDMFAEELPGGFDLHLISNVLHDWNEKSVRGLLGKSHRALEKEGRLVIHDVHINEDKSGPLSHAAYSSLLMHSSEGKCYSTSELYPMLDELGFRGMQLTETVVDRSFIIARKR